MKRNGPLARCQHRKLKADSSACKLAKARIVRRAGDGGRIVDLIASGKRWLD